MKLVMHNQSIDLPSLEQVLDAMPQYPASAAEVTLMAKHLQSPLTIIEYLGSLPPDFIFDSRDEAFMQAAEVIELRGELIKEPREYLRSYDE